MVPIHATIIKNLERSDTDKICDNRHSNKKKEMKVDGFNNHIIFYVYRCFS